MEHEAIVEQLLTLIGYGPDRVDGQSLDRLSAADWHGLLEMAAALKVTPLLYHGLVKRGLEDSIPPDAWRRLRQSYLANAAHGLGIYAELREIAAALQREGIAFIVLKGVHLAAVIYRNLALRVIGDIDLLVSRAALTRSAAALSALGYCSRRPFDVDLDADLAGHLHLPPMSKPEGVEVELHWAITPPDRLFSMQPEELWQRAESTSVEGVEALALSPEDLLLHVCMHVAYMHGFDIGLRPFCDIAEAVCHYGPRLDWEQVAARAHRWGWSRGTYLALHLAKEMVGADVPDSALNDLRPADVNGGAVQAARELVFSTPELKGFRFAELWGGARLREKMARLASYVFPSRLKLASMYPASHDSPRLLLYYPTHLMTLLRRYGAATVRLLRRDPSLVFLAERKNVLWDWLSAAERDEVRSEAAASVCAPVARRFRIRRLRRDGGVPL
jgi:hypothetical protein